MANRAHFAHPYSHANSIQAAPESHGRHHHHHLGVHGCMWYLMEVKCTSSAHSPCVPRQHIDDNAGTLDAHIGWLLHLIDRAMLVGGGTCSRHQTTRTLGTPSLHPIGFLIGSARYTCNTHTIEITQSHNHMPGANPPARNPPEPQSNQPKPAASVAIGYYESPPGSQPVARKSGTACHLSFSLSSRYLSLL